jgi:hypothetical protein
VTPVRTRITDKNVVDVLPHDDALSAHLQLSDPNC